MSRNKYSDEIRIQILDAAWKIFEKNDYEDVTMQQIVDAIDVSKEAVYYHFREKKFIFEEIIANSLEKELHNLEIILNNPNLTIKEKTSEFILCITSSKSRKKLIDYMCHQKKPVFFIKEIRVYVLKMTPLLSSLIRQGMEEGVCQTDYPDEAAEVFLILINIWLDPILFNESIEKQCKRLEYLADILVRSGIPLINDSDLNKIKEFYKLYF